MLLSGGRVSACKTETNDIENNLEPVDPEDMEDEDDANKLGESGGMRARPQAHMVDHYQFRS